MSEGEKTHAPTEHRIENLKLSGSFPLGFDLITFGVLLGIIGGASLALGMIVPEELFVDRTVEDATWKSLTSSTAIIIAIVGLGAFGALLFGVTQTRGFISWEARGRSPKGAGSPGDRFQDCITTVIQVVVVGVLAFSAIQASLILLTDENVAGLWRSEISFTSLRDLIKGFLAPVMLVIGFSAIGGRVLAVVRFRRRHRMSREEIDAEAREFEARPEYRRARVESYRHEG